ncbi:MAG: endolytic transglycosylase MltG [Collinsella sp.]|nr:endolytic transglycosylase MltG [Collinsella sp.]
MNVPNDRRDPRIRPEGPRPAGKRFRTDPAPRPQAPRPMQGRPQGSPYRATSPSRGVANRRAAKRRASALPALLLGGLILGVALYFIVPAVGSLLFPASSSVPAGEEVQVTIPEGASGDTIASELSKAHVVENPKDYYAAVERLDAALSIKPGEYLFKTGQDPEEVVRQLVEGPNVEGSKLVIQEGLTVQQTAANIESTYGIPAEEFLAQAKASNYEGDYPFLKGAYDDSLEGFLYPKTYSLGEAPTADEIIRALLDQFEVETKGLALSEGANGLSIHELISLASLVERETALADERPLVASVIYNRLKIDMPLQIDAAIVYARGGGNQPVTYADLEIDSPYNVYRNYGLTPGPICSPSVSSIKAAISPAETDYLYYVASSKNDGSHHFTDDYDEFLAYSEEYSGAGA